MTRRYAGCALVWAVCACRPDAAPADKQRTHETGSTTPSDGGGGDDGGGDDGGGTWSQPMFAAPPEATDLDDRPDVIQVSLVAQAISDEVVDWPTRSVLPIDGRGYNGSLPAPTIRAKVGDTVIIDLLNEMDDPTTIHWHGIDVPFGMDGVPMMGVDPVLPGESFRYEFVVDKSGTFWYHPHFDTANQVDRGLYGAFVVEDPDAPAVDRDIVLLLDDWREDQSMPADADMVHGAHGAEGLWTVNGLVQPLLALADGERVRLRLINTSNQGYVALSADGGLTVTARDQGALPSPEVAEVEVLAPGMRAELLWLPGAGAPEVLWDRAWSLAGGEAFGEDRVVLDLSFDGASPSASVADWPAAVEPPAADPSYTDWVYVFQGSAHTDNWSINGEQFPEVTIVEVSEGSETILEVRNLSATEHPFHLHGLTFELLSRNGIPPAQRSVHDTINLALYDVVRLKVLADNVGPWMLHCHILPHAEGGMMTVFSVVASE